MTEKEFFFVSCNERTPIHCILWLPEGEPRAVVQIAHGISSHVRRFAPLAEFLCGHGFAVAGNDHLGHGRSVDGEENRLFFGENSGWELVLGDMRKLTVQLKARFPGLPVFLLGHSMGSFLARCYAIRFPQGVDGLILSGTGHPSPALVSTALTVADREIRRHGSRWQSKRLSGLVFGQYNRNFAPARTPYDWLTRDETVVNRYISDASCGGIPTAGLFRDMMYGIRFMCREKNLCRMDKTLPVYFFAGEMDPVGECGKGVLRAYMAFIRAGMEDVTLKLYPGGRHEMLNEINRSQVRQDILWWLESKLA